MSGIREKHRITQSLKTVDLQSSITELLKLPASQVINPLFAGLCSSDERIRWHAITVMGAVVSSLAKKDMEAARVVMRRLMWSLNDESGGIGWGAPEAMAEIMACHDSLAAEYSHILVSYMREDGNFLELVSLQRGLLWGVGRLAQVKPDLLHASDAVRYLMPYLDSEDAAVLGLTAWTLGLLNAGEALGSLQSLTENDREVRLFINRRLEILSVGVLAEQAVTAISKNEQPVL